MYLQIPESSPKEKQREFLARKYGKNHSQEKITTSILINNADLLYYAFNKAKMKGNIEYRQEIRLYHHASL